MEPTLRLAVIEDSDAVTDLKRSVGYKEDPPQDWHWLWEDNPAWSAVNPKPSIGWVLEAESRIVGYLGNIPELYRLGEKTLLAATASGFAVDPRYRGYSLRLAASFFKQENVDLWLNTTANDAGGKISQRFRASPIPQEGYDQILFWVLRPQAFTQATLKKLGFHGSLAWLGSHLPAALLQADIMIRGKALRRKSYGPKAALEIKLLDLASISGDFDDLWNRKIKEPVQLLSYRTVETLKWHFSGHGQAQKPKVLCCYQDGKMVGYAIVVRDDSPALDLARSKIADIFVERDDPKVVDQLLLAAHELAKRDGSHVLEVMGFPKSIRARLFSAKPYTRFRSHWPYFY